MLFSIQRFGTGAVGRRSGRSWPCGSRCWRLGHARGGQGARILRALSPTYAVAFLFEHGHVAFLALGSVVLIVTGAEALYADMGHFGRRPIRPAWFLPCSPR